MNDHRDYTGGGGAIENLNSDGCSLKSRIFVGGLGASVTPIDLEATFSSLGRVHGVEIIRSNDRNFGYMDFEPFSDKALSKLFSSYNGCVWKGGRLRLEKAKEHYLAQLRQEWAAEAAQSATITAEVDASTASNTPDKRIQMLSEKSGLKMFFPRLKKIKILPSKGTGKHKYSFQRVESLPLHQLQVCSCNEHSMHPESDGSNHNVLNVGNDMLYDGGICEKEVNIMNRVMQKLFENEDQIQIETEQSDKTQPVHVYKYAKKRPGNARIDMEKFNDSDDTEGSNNSEAAVENLDEVAMGKNVAQDLIKGSDNIETVSLESDQVVKELKDDANFSRGIIEKIARKNTHESTFMKDKFFNVKSGEKDFRMKVQKKITPKNTNFRPVEGDAEYQPEVHEPEVKKRVRVRDTFCGPIQHEKARGNSNIDIGLEMKSNSDFKVKGDAEYQPEVHKPDVRKRVRVGDTGCGSIQHEEAQGNSNIGIGVEVKSNTDFKVQDSDRVSQLQRDTHSWVQKASWKNLVGETGRVSFSLSSIIGGISYSPSAVKSNASETDRTANNNSLEDGTEKVNRKMSKKSGNNGIQDGLQCSNEVSQLFRREAFKPPCFESEDKSELVGEMKIMSDAVEVQGPKENTTDMQRQDKSCKVDKDLQPSTPNKISSSTCTFMRSEDAEDEWLKSKEVVRGYAKARRKMALKNIKMLGVDPARRH